MTNIMKFLRNFKKDTEGVVAVEAVIFLPMLFWMLAAVVIFFDAYRTKSVTEKAAFTISDMLSRETNSINATYVTNTRSLFDAMTKSSSDSSMRISVIVWNESSDAYELEWSEIRGEGYVALDTEYLTELETKLPVMADQDTLILVETQTDYIPALSVGLGDMTFETFVFTRPRYAPRLDFASS